MAAVPDALAASARLTGSLRAIAAALASPDEPALLACEPALSQALVDLRAVGAIATEDRPALLGELMRARTELARCRTLGASAMDLAGTVLAAHGHQRYGDGGSPVAPASTPGSQMQARL